MSTDTAIRNTENTIKDRDYFQESTTWLQRSLNESKKELRVITDERDKLNTGLQNVESDVAEFSKRYDRATQARELTAKAWKSLTSRRRDLLTRVKNLELEQGTNEAVKAGVKNLKSQFEFTQDYENLQAFFVNFGARQVLSKLKGLYPTMDLSAVEVDYPTPEDTAQPPTDGGKDSQNGINLADGWLGWLRMWTRFLSFDP
ncbi:hypothetical protein Fot_14594 [Forsythia ovata]|uniref:Uncharacterized protein n=1 Tax=Forsythia ovata TaxID=205694 RepID=A0ABD1W768_9LAMI